MASRRALGFAYVYPALLLGAALASLFVGYGSRLGFFQVRDRFPVRPLEAEPFLAFEGAVLLACAFLATRAVARARAGKDMWTMRVYWPTVLGIFGVITLALFAVTLGTRGCAVAAWYAAYGCWDPNVTFLRVTLSALATAGFTYGLARVAQGSTRTLRPSAPKGPAEPDAAEQVEEIRAR